MKTEQDIIDYNEKHPYGYYISVVNVIIIFQIGSNEIRRVTAKGIEVSSSAARWRKEVDYTIYPWDAQQFSSLEDLQRAIFVDLL